MTGAQYGSIDCPVCLKRGAITADNSVMVRHLGADQRGMVDYLAYYCADQDECPGFLPLFLRQLGPWLIRLTNYVHVEETFAEPQPVVVDCFERIYGFRPQIGDDVPLNELSVDELVAMADLAEALCDDDAVAAVITGWTA